MWKINKKLLVFCAVVVILISAVRVASAHNRFDDKEKGNDSAESQGIVKYDNPIDEYYIPIFESDCCYAEIRGAQRCYYYVWKTEYENIIKWIQEKCKDDTDRKQIMKLDKDIQVCIDEYGKSLELVSTLDTDTPGIGLYADIMRIQGELYREYSIHLIESYGDEEPYIYMDRDYSEIIIP